jgi:RNA polymerase sigma factor for flagellar operon FliA
MKGLNAYQETARRNQQDELILTHLPLVRHVLGRLAADLPGGTDLENLESAGVLGLVEAARAFDPTRNVQFKTFAYTRVRGAIIDELRRNSPLSQQVQEKVSLVRKALRELTPPFTVEQLAGATGLSEDEVAEGLQAMRFVRQLAESPPLEGERDPNAVSPSRGLEEQERRRVLAEAVESLPAQERLVVVLYYHEELRLKEISEVLQLSESRVSRVLSAALLNLHGRLRARGLEA